MSTPVLVLGVLAFVAVAMLAAIMLQRLDSAISTPGESAAPEGDGSAVAAASPAKQQHRGPRRRKRRR